MFGTILGRMLLFELIKIFSLSLLTLTGLFVMAGVIAEASQRGLGPVQILTIIPLIIPSTLPYTIPTTTLFATCVVYGRLSADNEVTAIRAAGINLFTILKPCLVLGLATTLFTLTMSYHLIGYTRQLMKTTMMSDSEEMLYAMLRRNYCLKTTNMPYVIYVKDVQGKRLIDVVFKKRMKVGAYYVGYDLVARAREARLRVDQENNKIIVDMDRCSVFGNRNVAGHFKDRIFEEELPENVFGGDAKPRAMDMTWQQLGEDRVFQVAERERLAERIVATKLRLAYPAATPDQLREAMRTQGALTNACSDLSEDFTRKLDEVPIHLVNLENKQKDTYRQTLAIETEFQSRPALAVGCLCFVLVGCPVGIWFSRSDFLSTFVTCFLPVVFLYYPLMLCGSNLAKEGKMPIVPSVWAADALFGVIAVILAWRLLRR